MAVMKTDSDRPAPGGHAPRAGLIARGHAQAADGSCSYTARVEAALRRARDSAAAHVFTALHEESAREAARHADALARAGLSAGPLAGLPVSVKDLFDVAREPTPAGSRLRREDPPATADAVAVARLRAAGAALIGRTNMTEFAFSGVGINPHLGTPRNPCDAALARIPGGSSSGAAVSVALGIVAAALGSDTAGSIRVPAALCGVTGFKSTQSRVPLQGAFPLSHTLDTVCAMAPTVADCLVVDGVIAGAPLPVHPRTLAGVRLVLPGTVVLDALEPAVASAFSRALSALSAAGAQVVEEPLPELAEIAAINAPGGLSAVEAWATHRADMQARRDAFDPRVAARIALGEAVSAADYLRILQRRRDWIARMQARLAPFDALVCPTVPITAPAIEPLLASDEAFFRTNALLLRNTIVANFLDGCSFSLPCHAPGELPVGLMLTAPGGTDARLAEVALAAEAALTGRGVPGVQVSD
jgi:aspartyl-tRNA(Asn)/glutamyl-tRNA(Gln) amidotransferase subunit A